MRRSCLSNVLVMSLLCRSGRPAKRMSLNNAGGSETLCGFETSRVEPSAAEGEKVIRSAPRESAPNLQRSAGSAPLLQPKPQPVVPIPEGAVCRQMPKSALMCIDESGKGGASSTGKYSFEDFLRVCVIAPRAPAQAEVSMPGQQVKTC